VSDASGVRAGDRDPRPARRTVPRPEDVAERRQAGRDRAPLGEGQLRHPRRGERQGRQCDGGQLDVDHAQYRHRRARATGGRWRTFATARARGSKGAWRSSYTFAGQPGRYPVRLRIRREDVFPYDLGYSRSVVVRVK
jgi:hypothetical protein